MDEYFKQIASHKGSFAIYLVLRILISATMIYQAIQKDWGNVLLCLAVLVLFLVPSFVETKMHIRLPALIQNIFLVFVFCAEILGEMEAFYVYVPWWDKMLHTTTGFLVAAIGFSLIGLLNDSNKVTFTLSPFFSVVVAFCFSMTVGVCWEFGEYTMDRVFGMDCQKDTVIHEIHSITLDPAGGNTMIDLTDIHEVTVDGYTFCIDGYLDVGLYDTMEDLWVNCIGALVFCVIGYNSLKHDEKKQFIESLTVKKEERDES